MPSKNPTDMEDNVQSEKKDRGTTNNSNQPSSKLISDQHEKIGIEFENKQWNEEALFESTYQLAKYKNVTALCQLIEKGFCIDINQNNYTIVSLLAK